MRRDSRFNRWFWRCHWCHPLHGSGSATSMTDALKRMCEHLRAGRHYPHLTTAAPNTNVPVLSVGLGGCSACRHSGICGCVINPAAPKIWC